MSGLSGMVTLLLALPGPGGAGYQFLDLAYTYDQTLYGRAASALEGSAGSPIYNPALSPPAGRFEASLTSYVAHIKAGALTTGFKNTGIGLVFLSSGTMQRRDKDDTYLGAFQSNFLALSVSRRLKGPFGATLGVAPELLYQSIDNGATGIALAVSLGLYKPLEKYRVDVGLSVSHLGYELIKPADSAGATVLPAVVTLAARYSPAPFLKVGAALVKEIEFPFYFNLGGEWELNSVIAIGGGYNLKGRQLNTGGGKDVVNGFSAGARIAVSRFVVAYGYTPMGYLGDVHRLSLSYRWQ